jgi:hypothetical protein
MEKVYKFAFRKTENFSKEGGKLPSSPKRKCLKIIV